MAKVITYTTLFGTYDNLRTPKVGGRFLCFTDQNLLWCGWILQKVTPTLSAAKEARRYKLQPYLYMTSEYSIYVDANFEVNIQAERALKLLGDADIAVHRHPDRDCLYAEAAVCEAWGKAPGPVLQQQVQAYEASGYPRGNGLYEGGIIIRRHTPRIRALGEAWWKEVSTHSTRDQISFPYVCWRLGIEPKVIPGQARNNDLWRWGPHGG